MYIDLRYAGLKPESEQRMRLAATALAAHRLRARASAWDGTQCDIVAVDIGDGYGRHVIEIADRRGTPVLAIGDTDDIGNGDHTRIAAAANVSMLTKALYRMLLQAGRVSHGSPVDEPREAVVEAATVPALIRLVTDPQLAKLDLEAKIHDTTLWLLPSAGRVLSATVSDRLSACGKFGLDDWTFTALDEPRRAHPPGEVSASLDVFYLQAAWQIRSRLPPFPNSRCNLLNWPDLGTAPDFVDVLRIVQLLQRGNLRADEIVESCGTSAQDVSACLWAFSASGILAAQESEPRRPPVAASRPGLLSTGLLSRLAAHFGLSRH